MRRKIQATAFGRKKGEKYMNRRTKLHLGIFVVLTLFTFFYVRNSSTVLAARQDPGGAPPTAAQTANQLEIERYAALHPTLKKGDTAPDFSVVDAQGRKHQLSDYKSYPILAIVFTCAHCPYAQSYEDRIQKLYDDYTPKGVAVIAVNPNANAAMAPSEFEWTDVDDSQASIGVRQRLRRLTFPYFYDGNTQAMALK